MKNVMKQRNHAKLGAPRIPINVRVHA